MTVIWKSGMMYFHSSTMTDMETYSDLAQKNIDTGMGLEMSCMCRTGCRLHV